MGETVLVTGGTGYVAGWCVAELLKRGYTVRATVRSAAKGEHVRAAVSSEVDPEDRLRFAIADLTSDNGWADAMKGVGHVLHVASPMGMDGADTQSLVVPARDGTLRVLRAATEAGVKRVVMTSAANTASPSSYRDESVSDETVWTDVNDPTLQPYRRSKTAAEKAAWDFMAGYDGPMTLATVLPGAVFGPVLGTGTMGSVRIIGRLLKGMPGTPRIGFEIVDVRDLADAHIRAMTAPEAAGQRFLATGEFMWMLDMARALRDGLGADGAKAPTRNLPDIAVRGMSLFDRTLKEIMPALGRRAVHTTAKAERVLGWKSRPAAEVVVDCGRSLLSHNLV
ncbi:NAD-dependent epimerase/dehydratase family protein [Kutzneria sp. NPDC052558]|uniref:NAD-dependent epimerase/dehydratase family protein n=1 Tax=Kutzneria sp. NPDC052558 TaxID=3364121 RepID=UPI0037CB3A52